MSAASPTYAGVILSASVNVISSRVLEAGLMLSISPAGPAPSGPGAAPVSPSAPPASVAEPPTSAICGPSSTDLSPSASLQLSLESRLRARMGAFGSPEYELTWKHWGMQSGPPICALRASGRRISDNGCSGWPTPNALPVGRGGLMRNPEAAMRRRTQGHMLNLDDAATLVGWPTPRSVEATPTVNDSTGSTHCYSRGDPDRIVLKLPGQALLGSPASTENRGALNPAHSRWLMGFPPEWDDCAATAMPSSRKSRRSS